MSVPTTAQVAKMLWHSLSLARGSTMRRAVLAGLSLCIYPFFTCVLTSSDALAGPIQVGSAAFSANAQTVDFLGFPDDTIVTNQLASSATFGLTFSSMPQPQGAQGGIKVSN